MHTQCHAHAVPDEVRRIGAMHKQCLAQAVPDEVRRTGAMLNNTPQAGRLQERGSACWLTLKQPEAVLSSDKLLKEGSLLMLKGVLRPPPQ